MAKKKNRSRKGNSGWAHTKKFPHESHPARYRRVNENGDEVEYITFTHSSEVDLGNRGKVQTVPLSDNISPAERQKNRAEGKKFGENRSYAYPKVYQGKRSTLHKETDEFDPVDSDKKRIEKMFEVFPREKVPVTGGKTKYRQRQKKKSRK
jgi:hypothetical protein